MSMIKFRALRGTLIVVAALYLVNSAIIHAQEPPVPQVSKPTRLNSREKNYLMLLAKEPLKAQLEGREPRTPRDNPAMKRLDIAQPMVVTLYLNNEPVARVWELRSPGPIATSALALGAKVLSAPDIGRVLTIEELAKAKMGFAVFEPLEEIKSDNDLKAGQGAVVINGFTFGVGLPGDMPKKFKPAELLSKACQLSGLRPGAWLTDKTVIFAALVDEEIEK
ncbi:MAG: hypothetical protein LBV23_09445 [Deltaproteobacteria bacterium]|nr:hypothetical protein [Deltaproteobacteria bacterium]